MDVAELVQQAIDVDPNQRTPPFERAPGDEHGVDVARVHPEHDGRSRVVQRGHVQSPIAGSMLSTVPPRISMRFGPTHFGPCQGVGESKLLVERVDASDIRSLNNLTSSTSSTTTAQQIVPNSARAPKTCQRDRVCVMGAGASEARSVSE